MDARTRLSYCGPTTVTAPRGGGFVPGKHELYPFPFDVIELNPWDEETGTGLKQNPGWE